jgi:anthranilate synthase component I
LYRALRSLNPSPYMFYYDFGGFHVVGSSPEILVRLEGDTVTLRPIAGTRPRGLTREDDQRLAEELLADPKECAEHLQLLDLGRNDTGRVAVTGSVKVTENMQIERYSHVMHIVSNVEGKLKPGLRALDVLRASFPAGTVSGAPKVRAMEIIDELEPSKRGIYAGAVGYLGFNGDMDLAIAIRTAVVKDGRPLRAGRRRHRRRLGARKRMDRKRRTRRAPSCAPRRCCRLQTSNPGDAGGRACGRFLSPCKRFQPRSVGYRG